MPKHKESSDQLSFSLLEAQEDPAGTPAVEEPELVGLKLFVVVRHGDYDRATGSLTQTGRNQMARISQALGILWLQADSATMICSTISRASESAQIVADGLDGNGMVFVHPHDALADTSEHPAMGEVYELVEQQHTDLLVMVAHYGQARWLPPYFFRQKFGLDFANKELGTGEAWLIDVEAQTCSKLALK